MPTLVLKPTDAQDVKLLLSLAHRLRVEISLVPTPDPTQLESRFLPWRVVGNPKKQGRS
ncbi:hypothetical protein SAMN06269173_12326 [Hymenobacter mucosus]|uniref:Uncharacterized protein n=1 Tax=Hymenobacter mucosus TaxID=1411120 RepID=A0A239BIF9_9BACT|nr:hypothetical protein SAMN06269173_12326 [Hymenobacter mucosus]